MTERHIMVDLETMSTRPDAAIVAIGAYVFDPFGYDVECDRERNFYRAVRLDSSLAYGLRVDGEAVTWWLRQSDAARAAIVDDAISLDHALHEFAHWVALPPEQVILWSHAGFDYPIVQNAYAATNVASPLWYRSPRDLRTIIHAAFGRNLDVEEEVGDFPANPLPHHAAYDAWHQALMVQHCFRLLADRQLRSRLIGMPPHCYNLPPGLQPRPMCPRCGGTGWEQYLPREAMRPEWIPCMCTKEVAQ